MKRLLIILTLIVTLMPTYADDIVAINYHCRPDSAGWAVFYTSPDKASQIMFENKAERLTVRSAADETPITGLPTIVLYSAILDKIETSCGACRRP